MRTSAGKWRRRRLQKRVRLDIPYHRLDSFFARDIQALLLCCPFVEEPYRRRFGAFEVTVCEPRQIPARLRAERDD